MLDDAVQREFCRPPDQTLLALAGDDQVGRLLVADSWRSLPVSLCGDGRSNRGSRSRSLAERRPGYGFTGSGSPNPPASVRSSGHIAGTVGCRVEAMAREQERPKSAPGVDGAGDLPPVVAAFADAPWIRKVVFVAQDDWASGEGVRPWWPIYSGGIPANRRAKCRHLRRVGGARVAHLQRVTVVPNGISPRLAPAVPGPGENCGPAKASCDLHRDP